MNLCIIGSGYVGLVTAACFADMGNEVWCIDKDEAKIDMLKRAEIPIYEPGLAELVRANLQAGRLHFSSQIMDGLQRASLCFIAVGTPPQEDGSADINHVLDVARSIGRLMDTNMIVVNKSTVPVGTAAKVSANIEEELRLRGIADLTVEVVSNPEFLKEGAAIEDFMRPDRIVIGADNVHGAEIMQQLYEPFTRNNHPILIMDVKSAELSKYAANAMLAMRISFMNELAQLCDLLGADIAHVRTGIGSDSRIGMPFLYAGAGYGGSCLPKDVKELIETGRRTGLAMEIVTAVERVNERQKYYLLEMIVKRFGQNLQGKTFALWGLAFKPQTDDMRAAPSLLVVNELLQRGARIKAYDPAAMERASQIWDTHTYAIDYAEQMLDTVTGADAIILLTEWRQFRQVDFKTIKTALRNPIVFDGRNQYRPEQMREMGFEYYCVGRSCSM